MMDTTVEVTAAHGSGKVIVKENGVLFRETTSEKAIPELELIFEVTGRMAIGAVAEITLPKPKAIGRTSASSTMTRSPIRARSG